MGGTFLSLDRSYKDWFIRNLHDALRFSFSFFFFSSQKEGKLRRFTHKPNFSCVHSGHTSHSVKEAISFSERSKSKCIGITIETRPDFCLKPHLNELLSYGCTRIEIGVQAIYEDIARDTNRGHTGFILSTVARFHKLFSPSSIKQLLRYATPSSYARNVATRSSRTSCLICRIWEENGISWASRSSLSIPNTGPMG